MRKFIFSSINRRKVQSLSVIISVAVATAVLFAFGLVHHGVSRGIELSSQRLGADMLVIPDHAQTLLSETELLFTGAPAVMYMDKALVEQAMEIEGVVGVTSQFFGHTLPGTGCCAGIGAVRLIGIDVQSDWIISPWLSSQFGENLFHNEIIVGSDLTGMAAQSQSVLGYMMHPVAQLEPTGTSLDYSMLMDIDTLRHLVKGINGFEHFWETYGEPETLISALFVQVEPGQEPAVIRALLRLGDVAVIEQNSVIREVNEQMNVVFAILLGCGILLALVSALQLWGRFFNMVWNRKNELGLYKALGANKRDLKLMVAGEALILSGIGISAGLVGGGIIYSLILDLLRRHGNFPFVVPSAGVIVIIAVILAAIFSILSLSALMVPIRQVSKIDPSSAMRCRND